MINVVNITPLTVFLVWLSVVSLTLLFYSAYKLRNAYKKLSITSDEEKKRWQELEQKAQNDYQEIIAVANKKAEEIISQANNVNTKSVASFEDAITSMLQNQKDSLETNSLEISKKHEQEVKELNNKIIILLTNIYKDIESTSRADLEAYKAAIKKQTFDAEKLAEEKVQQEYLRLEKEIEEKKAKKMQELEENIYKIISNISKDIIGKSLDLSSHEDLIVKSLDDAKNEGVI